MLKPLVIQDLLDSLTSHNGNSVHPHLAMLTIADSGQVYASSRSDRHSSSRCQPKLIHPRPKFKALMCPVKEDCHLDDEDDKDESLAGALATRAWTEHKRAIKKSNNNEVRGHECNDLKLGLTLKNESLGIIHVQPLFAIRSPVPPASDLTLPSPPSESSRNLDEEESQFAAIRQESETPLLLVVKHQIKSDTTKQDEQAIRLALSATAQQVAAALAPELNALALDR
ncbi:unnamed protein product [Sympodiomycopsis kandeliae]